MGSIAATQMLLGRSATASIVGAGAGTLAFIVALSGLLLASGRRGDARPLPFWIAPGVPIAALLSVMNGVQRYVEGASAAAAVTSAGISAAIFMLVFPALSPWLFRRGGEEPRRGVSVRTAVIIIGGIVALFAVLIAFLWSVSAGS